MSNNPTNAPLNTTSGTTSSTTNLPGPQIWDVGAQAYSADPGNKAVILTGNATPSGTSLTISLGSLLAQNNILLDAQFASIVIVNSGTSQTITKAQLQFTDTVGGVNITESYDLPEVAAVPSALQGNGTQSGSAAICRVPLRGIMKNAQVVVTFGASASAGTVYVQAHFYAHAFHGNLPMRMVGSFNATGTNNFVSNSGNTPNVVGVLHREAVHRQWIIFNNNTGVTPTVLHLTTYESTSPGASGSDPSVGQYANLPNFPANNQQIECSDIDYQQFGQRLEMLAYSVDSFWMNIGETSPTGGSIDVYVIETL